MITLDELLIKIGVDGSQAQKISGYVDMLQGGADSIGASANSINDKLDGMLKEVSNSLGEASNAADQASKDLNKAGKSAEKTEGKISKLKVAMVALIGGAMLFGNKIASAFNAAINNAEQLFKSKNALFAISKNEIAQVDQYKKSLDKTSLSINSIRTKIAINLVPALTAVSEKFNGWLVTNKDFITNGISKVILWLGRGVQVITNFMKFIDKVVRSTIGWKNAFIALGIAWAVLNRAFLFSPIGIVIGLFGALLLLVDDLMVHLDGGKSLFGEYWDPLISGGQSVIEFFKNGEKIWVPILIGLLTYLSLLGGKSLFSSIIGGIKSIGTAFKVLRAIMMTNPIIAILTAIAMVAYLIYDNWDWLCAQFKEIWSSIVGFTTKAWDSIVSTVSNAIKEVLMYFGMSEDEADSVVSAIGDIFSSLFDLLLYPFKAAYEFVEELFKIWTDDNTKFIDKVGNSFSALFDFIVSPFKKAMAWIDDKFNGFIDKTIGAVTGALSFIGIDVDWGKKDKQDPLPTSGGAGALLMPPSIPMPNNSDNRVTNNSMEAKTNITVYANDSKDGARQVASAYERQLDNANDLMKHRNNS